MNLDHLKLTLTQIGNLVKQINNKNFVETTLSLNQVSFQKKMPLFVNIFLMLIHTILCILFCQILAEI